MGGVLVLAAVLLPSWLTLRSLRARTRAVEAEIIRLETAITQLSSERDKLQSDPTYMERVARQEFRATRPGETLFKIEEAADGPAEPVTPPTGADSPSRN